MLLILCFSIISGEHISLVWLRKILTSEFIPSFRSGKNLLEPVPFIKVTCIGFNSFYIRSMMVCKCPHRKQHKT